MVTVLKLAFMTALFNQVRNRNHESAKTAEQENLLRLGIIFKNEGNPYGESVIEGFKEAGRELNVEVFSQSPIFPTAGGQIDIIEEFEVLDMDVIAVAANSYNGLQDATAGAMTRGVRILSYDAPMNPDSRIININAANPEVVGRTLVQSAYHIMDGEGKYIILSATPESPNQNLWISWMHTEAIEERYKDMELVDILYSNDDLEQSRQVTLDIIENYPDVKLIIAPTTVAMLGVAQVIYENRLENRIKVTGLGLPSEMEFYVTNNVVPYFYLWVPVDLGYLAAYTGYALYTGEIEGIPGEIFHAGRLGNQYILEGITGGSDINLGDLMLFDKENIDDWLFLCNR